MTNTRAAKADTQKTDNLSAEEVAEAQRAAATKSAREAEKLPAASAPAVASEAAAAKSDTTLTAGEAANLKDKSKGDFGPFTDNAPPVGAALDAITADEDASVFDFDVEDVPFTIVEGGVQVAVREHLGRNIIEVSPAGWIGPGTTFGANQVKSLLKALHKVDAKTKKRA